MSYKPSKFGQLVKARPAQAAKELSRDLRGRSVTQVAEIHAVKRVTVYRWIEELRAAGHDVAEPRKQTQATTEFGRLLASSPKKAQARLVALFRKHRTVAQVAAVIEPAGPVGAQTVWGWLAELKEAGLPDPREGLPGAPSREPKHAITAQAESDPGAARAALRQAFRQGAVAGESTRAARLRAAKNLGVSEITVRRLSDRLGL